MKNKIISITILVVLGTSIFFSLKSTHKDLPADAVTKQAQEEIKQDQATLATPVSATRYENKKYGFSFEKPAGYTVGILHDDVGETVLVQNSKISSGFQIYITPTDGNTILSKEQIEKDLPGTSVINPETIRLDNKAGGMMFESSSPAPGTFEIWFSYQNFLYQVSSYKEFAGELQKIINTWKFSK